jgi:pteridine reductase
LHAAGANIFLHYRSSAAAAAALIEEFNRARAGSAATACANLLDAQAPERLVSAALGQFGRLDILINNASNFYPTPVGRITAAVWDDLIGINLRAPAFLAQAAVDSLARQRGLILNVIDIHGLRPLKGYPVYSAAKAGLAMLTRSLARELGPDNIAVNAIAPGLVAVEATEYVPQERKDLYVNGRAMQRVQTPEDVTGAVVFLLGQGAGFVTGQLLPVNGGFVLN